jgi:hypothetical protein
MHFCSTSVRVKAPTITQERCRPLTCYRYFAQKLLFGSPFYDGGMLHNNPIGISSHQGSKIWNCPAIENLRISVGCGDLKVQPSGRNSLARLWSAFSHKLSPAKEEEIRALWGAEDPHYERLDPKLDMPEIPLDNLQVMLDTLSAIKTTMSTCKDLKRVIRRTSWKLISATFYADVTVLEDLGSRKRIRFRIHCRLDEEAELVWRKWPGVYFCIDGREVHHQKDGHPYILETECVSNGHVLDITLNLGRGESVGRDTSEVDPQSRSASISGFPILVSSLPVMPRRAKAPSVLGKRKRSYDA